jgi:UDP-GlcNAc:undecaprenyl-phosphate GlcNAc-1-phosphate transferase
VELNPLFIQAAFFAWLVIIPNSVNLLDGVDGLTSSVCSVFLVAASAMSLMVGELGWLIVLLPALSSTLGFLRFNWRPAKIFLGDSGSLLLGFCVAYMSLLLATTPASGENWNPVISLSLSFVWVLDTVLAIIRRYWGRKPSIEILLRRSRGTYLNLQRNALANIVRPDRKHLHHRMMDRGLSSQSIALTLSGISLSFSLIGLAVWSEAYLSHATWSSPIASMEVFIGLSGLVGLTLMAAYPLRKAKR